LQKFRGGGVKLTDDTVLYDFDKEFKAMDNNWYIPIIKGNAKERTGYPTQKPLALLNRIIKASSNPGDVVLDPFCGCATACVAAEQLEREWIGIDISPAAETLLKRRLHKAQDEDEKGEKKVLIKKNKDAGKHIDIEVLRYPADRTDSETLSVNKKEVKHTLFGQQEGICKGCLLPFPYRNFTIDHIRPVSKGGQDIESNLQLLCGACNSTKGNRTMEELIADLTKEGVRKQA